MATIRKRGARWQVQVRRQGCVHLSQSFLTKSDAEAWGRQKEVELDRGDVFVSDQSLKNHTLGALLTRYLEEVTPTKRGCIPESARIRAMLRHSIAGANLSRLKPFVLAAYRDERLRSVSAPTVRREMGLLQTCFEVARREWGVPLTSNPVAALTKPSHGRPRDRRLGGEDLASLNIALASCRNPLVRHVFLFALATGMRRGEVLSLTWANVDWDNRVAFLPMTKNGEPRRVPLSPAAMQSLRQVQDARQQPSESLPEPSCDLVFPISPNAFRLAWERVKRRAGIEDLRFHDLRHEAISRFFEIGLSVPEVALISGHKDARMLFRYTHLRAEEVAKKLA